MASVRFADLQSRPTEFLDFTSLTLDEFQQLVPPFEAAFQAHMVAWRLNGKPRTARQFSVYKRKHNKKVAVHPCPEHLCVQDTRRGDIGVPGVSGRKFTVCP